MDTDSSIIASLLLLLVLILVNAFFAMSEIAVIGLSREIGTAFRAVFFFFV